MIFTEFFFLLRKRGIPVSLGEWMLLLQALKSGLGNQSLLGFYQLCRTLCVKRVEHFDIYDQCFAHMFTGVELPPNIHEDFWDWLQSTASQQTLNKDWQNLKSLDLKQLMEQFEDRLRSQKERHDGGSHWIGTGGTSPFGHSGAHPSGIRVGGLSHRRSAMQVAGTRNYLRLRQDGPIDSRSMAVALKKLRRLAHIGETDALDLEESIRATGREAGDITLVFRPSKRNTVKLLLMMDVGGSMTHHSLLCEQLFLAASQNHHFQKLEKVFFHNCIYDWVWRDDHLTEAIATEDVLANKSRDWLVVIVGDAAMHPYELLAPGGAIDYSFQNKVPGIEWLRHIQRSIPKLVWLNPEPRSQWDIPSNTLVRSVIPSMFPLTSSGVEQAVATLLGATNGFEGEGYEG